MSEAENLLVRINFIVHLYNSGVISVEGALEKIFDLVDGYEEEVTE